MVHQTAPRAQTTATTPAPGSIRLSRFTSDSDVLTKVLRLDTNKRLSKSTKAYLTSGSVETLTLETIDDFAALLPSLQAKQALAYGVSKRGDGAVLSERRWEQAGSPAGVLLRNRDHFDWPAGGGVWMLDYDPPKDGPVLPRDALLQSLYAVMPELTDAAHLWWPSTGSCIYNSETGDELVGVNRPGF